MSEEDYDEVNKKVELKLEFTGIADLHRKIQEGLKPETAAAAREKENNRNLKEIAENTRKQKEFVNQVAQVMAFGVAAQGAYFQ